MQRRGYVNITVSDLLKHRSESDIVSVLDTDRIQSAAQKMEKERMVGTLMNLEILRLKQV